MFYQDDINFYLDKINLYKKDFLSRLRAIFSFLNYYNNKGKEEGEKYLSKRINSETEDFIYENEEAYDYYLTACAAFYTYTNLPIDKLINQPIKKESLPYYYYFINLYKNEFFSKNYNFSKAKLRLFWDENNLNEETIEKRDNINNKLYGIIFDELFEYNEFFGEYRTKDIRAFRQKIQDKSNGLDLNDIIHSQDFYEKEESLLLKGYIKYLENDSQNINDINQEEIEDTSLKNFDTSYVETSPEEHIFISAKSDLLNPEKRSKILLSGYTNYIDNIEYHRENKYPYSVSNKDLVEKALAEKGLPTLDEIIQIFNNQTDLLIDNTISLLKKHYGEDYNIKITVC